MSTLYHLLIIWGQIIFTPHICGFSAEIVYVHFSSRCPLRYNHNYHNFLVFIYCLLVLAKTTGSINLAAQLRTMFWRSFVFRGKAGKRVLLDNCIVFCNDSNMALLDFKAPSGKSQVFYSKQHVLNGSCRKLKLEVNLTSKQRDN